MAKVSLYDSLKVLVLLLTVAIYMLIDPTAKISKLVFRFHLPLVDYFRINRVLGNKTSENFN